MNTSVMIPLKNGRQTKHEILRAEPHQRMSQRSYWRGCLGSVSHFCCEVSPPETTTQMFLKQKSLYCQPVAAQGTCPNHASLSFAALSLSFMHKTPILVAILQNYRSQNTSLVQRLSQNYMDFDGLGLCFSLAGGAVYLLSFTA